MFLHLDFPFLSFCFAKRMNNYCFLRNKQKNRKTKMIQSITYCAWMHIKKRIKRWNVVNLHSNQLWVLLYRFHLQLLAFSYSKLNTSWSRLHSLLWLKDRFEKWLIHTLKSDFLLFLGWPRWLSNWNSLKKIIGQNYWFTKTKKFKTTWIKWFFFWIFPYYQQNGSTSLSDYCDGVLCITWIVAICQSTVARWQNIRRSLGGKASIDGQIVWQ